MIQFMFKFLNVSFLSLFFFPGHYIENTGNTTLKFIEILKTSMWLQNYFYLF
ncbi:hypothetical protein BYT27DRAFT_7185698 [Phlegmacium glaucopus]|nr:hypothetical protein BYT27DRAFT_7185698 [Phlegmacium glaucopus]